MRFVLVALLLLLAHPAAAQPGTIAVDPLMHGAVDGVIRPGIIAFARRTSGMVSAMEALCAAPSAAAVDIARGRFREAALSYAAIEVIGVGPLLEDDRAARLLAWPDSEGAGLRRVRDILAEADETATDPALLGKSEPAVQGLSALEYVLYGSGADSMAGSEDSFRCRYGLALARNAEGIAQTLATGWYRPDGVAQRLLAPGPDGDVPGAEVLVTLLSHGLRAMRETRLRPLAAAAADPEAALFWRSGLTIAMLQANLHGLRDLFTISGLGRTAGPVREVQGDRIELEFRKMAQALAWVSQPSRVPGAEPDQALDELVATAQTLQALIDSERSAALAQSAPFARAE
jgi:hypothetical protein